MSGQAIALQYAFFAERAAAKVGIYVTSLNSDFRNLNLDFIFHHENAPHCAFFISGKSGNEKLLIYYIILCYMKFSDMHLL